MNPSDRTVAVCILNLPNLDGDDDTDATESIGDVGLTQELTF